MRQKAIPLFCIAIALAAVSIAPRPAVANKLDLALARFMSCNSTTEQCTANVAKYERFLSEYAFGLSPKILASAETLGYSGFYLGIEGTLTTLPTDSKGGKERWRDGTSPSNSYPGTMFAPAVHIRKGLPWSFELGGTINYLSQSELVGLGLDLKWSLLEGFRHGFRGALPDLAVRGSVVRVLGESDIDMTVLGVDGSISYPFGIGGMVSLTPYGGFQYLWTIARIEPLVYRDDRTDPPTFKPASGGSWDMTGLTGPNLSRAKLFFGLALNYEILAITAELGWGIAKDWEAEDGSADVHVGHQLNIALGVGLNF